MTAEQEEVRNHFTCYQLQRSRQLRRHHPSHLPTAAELHLPLSKSLCTAHTTRDFSTIFLPSFSRSLLEP